MNSKIRKKLLHFYSGGSVAEDFSASRRKKTAFFRKVIRICFYIHCCAAAGCALTALLMRAGAGVVVPIAVCSAVSVVCSFFSAGRSQIMKISLCAVDFVFAAAGITLGAAIGEAAYTVCGIIMLAALAAAVVSYLAASFKRFLESYSPRQIKREDYTLIRNFSDEEIPELPTLESIVDDEEIPEFPPLTSEMRELANRLSDILRDPPDIEL